MTPNPPLTAHSSTLIAHLKSHWHHHLTWLSAIAIVVSFVLGAGATYAYVAKGGYHPGPLPPRVVVPRIEGGPIPPAHSLARFIVRIHDQGTSNSCVGQTLSTIKEITVKEHRLASHSSQLIAHSSVWFSAGYIYDQANGGSDNGTSYQTAFEILRTQGDAKYRLFPHDGQDWWVQPTPAAIKNASHYKVQSWRSIDPSDRYTISYEIAHGRPVAIALPINSSWNETSFWLDPSIPTDYADSGSFMFWHSMTAIAYDPTGVTLLNSWGPQFGHRGLIRVAWNVIASASAGGAHAAVVVSQPLFPSPRPQKPTSQAHHPSTSKGHTR